MKKVLTDIISNKLSIFSFGLALFMFWKDAEGIISDGISENILPLVVVLIVIFILLIYQNRSKTKNRNGKSRDLQGNVVSRKAAGKFRLARFLYTLSILVFVALATFLISAGINHLITH